MELSKKMLDALNEQLRQEQFASHLYLSMSTYFEDENLSGFAGWMRAQALEETAHAMKFYTYIIERGSRVTLGQLDAPKTDWKDAEEAFADALEHEQKVTKMINNLVKIARDEDDYATETFLHWFVDEQVEEEDSVGGVLETLKMIAGSKNGLVMLDRELGRRQTGGE